MKVYLTGLIALMFLLAACGGSGSSPTGNTVLTEDVAEAFVSSALSSNALLPTTFSNPAALANPFGAGFLGFATEALPAPTTRLLQQSLAPQQSDDCVTETGSTLDADNDGIPASSGYLFNCSESAEGVTYSFQGSMTVTDKNDNDPSSGYSIKIPQYDFSFNAAGETVSLKMRLDLDLTVSGSSYTADYDFDYDISTPDESAKIAYDYSYTYTPDSATNPFAGGTIAFDGTMSVAADGESFSLETSSTGLHFPAGACQNGFDSGTARYADNAGNSLTVTYNSCTSVTATYNGSPIAITAN